jgi:propionyl-CoA synthetase
VPFGFLVLKSGVVRSHDEIVGEVVQLVREKIGPVAFFKQAVVVDRLPKTRSGKILRGTMQAIAECREWRMPATIDDPSAIEVITTELQRVGYAVQQGGSPAG